MYLGACGSTFSAAERANDTITPAKTMKNLQVFLILVPMLILVRRHLILRSSAGQTRFPRQRL
jgi:hypothetical protein